MSLSGPGVRILLVDDDPVILRGYGQRMRGEGWDVTTASDGYEALTASAQKVWDLILLDLRIPYRNGVEVLRLLRQRPETQQTKIYLLAQPGDADFVDRAMREGADGVFEKARLGPRDVVQEISKILDQSGRTPGPSRPQQPPMQAVPAAVDEIARRFRRGDGGAAASASGTGRAPGWTSPSGIRPSGTSGSSYGSATSASAPRSAGGLPPYGILEEDDPPSRAASATTPAPVAPPPAAPQQVVAMSAQASAPMPPVAAPLPAPSHGHPGTMPPVAPPTWHGARTQTEPGPAQSYDTMLNRLVGQSSQLAAALGLPTDFTCPICKTQLVLRLTPDPTEDNGVRGHFYCARCTGGR